MAEQAVGGKRFAMQQAIQDALDHALFYSDDVTAFALTAILRGATCGVPAAVSPLRLDFAA